MHHRDKRGVRADRRGDMTRGRYGRSAVERRTSPQHPGPGARGQSRGPPSARSRSSPDVRRSARRERSPGASASDSLPPEVSTTSSASTPISCAMPPATESASAAATPALCAPGRLPTSDCPASTAAAAAGCRVRSRHESVFWPRTATRPFVADPVAEVPGEGGERRQRPTQRHGGGLQPARPLQYLFCEGGDFGNRQSG